jgi:cytosine/adenosine deaminase-related metal-dependent hydrolase
LNQDEYHTVCPKQDWRRSLPNQQHAAGFGHRPVRASRDAGVPVGLGVDGSASNDGSHLLNEVRQCLLLQRVLGNPRDDPPREALEIATLGAAVLGRDDIGALVPGMAAGSRWRFVSIRSGMLAGQSTTRWLRWFFASRSRSTGRWWPAGCWFQQGCRPWMCRRWQNGTTVLLRHWYARAGLA